MDNQNPNNQVPPAGNNASGPTQTPSKGLMETLEYYFVTKAPFQIPANIKELIVKFTPWLNVIFLLTIIPLALAVIGLGSLFTFYAGAYGYHSGWSFYYFINLAILILGVMALPGLFARKKSGWNMTFYEIALSFVGSIFYGNMVGAIVGAVISFYVLFQVKSYYK